MPSASQGTIRQTIQTESRVVNTVAESLSTDVDEETPMNWPRGKKWANILTISVISFLVPLVSSMLAPGIRSIMEDFHSNSTIFPTFAVSIFVLGFASGPLLLAPLSEVYGRTVVYHVTNVLLIVFTVLCAIAWSEASLLAFRFLSGFVGVATITIGSGTIADIMPKEERGKAVSIWSVGTVVGPMIGPIIGGAITESLGWRWMFWIMSAVIGLATILAFAILRETYAPVLLTRKAARLRARTRNREPQTKHNSNTEREALVSRSIARPLRLLLFCPIVTLMCTYVAFIYGIIYLFFATFAFAYTEVYRFSIFDSGLVFVACGIGTLLGLLYLAWFSDMNLKKRIAGGNRAMPEDRLPFVITVPGALMFPVGIFVYGWAVESHMPWIVSQVGTAVTGFGYILIFTGIQTYLIDAFEEYAASVIAANAVLRGVAGALIPLSGLSLYRTLGWGWGNSLLAFVSLFFAPSLWVFGIYGARIRESKRFSVGL